MIEEDYRLKNRDENVRISFDEDFWDTCVISAFNGSGSKIGSIQIHRLEEGKRGRTRYSHLLLHLSLDALGDQYLRQGIGTRMLELYREHCVEDKEAFFARDSDGIGKEDGSHLTGDGVPFVEAMVALGLLDSGGSQSEPEDDEMEEYL